MTNHPQRRRLGAALSAVILPLVWTSLLWLFVSSTYASVQAEAEAGPAASIPAAGPRDPLRIPEQGPAATNVGGTLTQTTTWTKAGGPYTVTTDVIVPFGITLTVEPGVEVRFQQNRFLKVAGALAATGTLTEPITFTATTPQPAWWLGLRLEGSLTTTAQATLDHVTVEYGGLNTAQSANLFLTYATATVRNSLFRNGGQHGVYGWLKGFADLIDSTFADNPGYAVYLHDVTSDSLLQHLTAAGNGTDAVAIGFTGFISGTHRWEAAGLPYFILGGPVVAADGILTVEPGVELRFASNTYLEAEGTLVAAGTATQPITFTGTTQQPAWWQGLRIWGAPARPARATLDYVTVEYGGIGGSGANVSVDFGQVSIAHSLVQHSGNDGLRVANGTGTSLIETSQVVANAGYGVRNFDTNPSHIVLAANNWWGSASGPADPSCNPSGIGSQVGPRVAFVPYLTSSSAVPGYVVPAQAPILSITPQRWFVEADGVSRAWVTFTLRDGAGQPLPGRTTRLTSTRGTVVDGGITNAQGQALAYVTSATAGDAELVGLIDLQNSCEFVRAPAAKITFTSVNQAGDLMAGGEAPYMSSRIQINPLPVTRGIPTTLRARVTNPYSLPISVSGEFAFAQAGIGLAFGPLGSVPSQVIPPNSEGEFTVLWTPPVAGHYCVQFIYSWQFASSAGPSAVAAGGGSSQLNLNTYSGPMGSPAGKASLATADKAFRVVSKLPGGHPIPKAMVGRWWNWTQSTASTISQNLGGDPPRLDYTVIALPVKRSLPVLQQGDEGISAARAAAINALNDAMMELRAYGEAATLSLDRYAGATEAGDLTWASQQAAAQLYYQGKMAEAAVTAADRIDALLLVLNGEGVQQALLTVAEITAYQQRLAAQGYDAQEIADAYQAGLTDEQIEALRLETIAADPAESAGDFLVFLSGEASALRRLAATMIYVPNFPPGGARHSGLQPVSGTTALTTTVDLVRVFETVSTIQVGNPLTQTAVIDLRMRRIDVPADWTLEVMPSSVTLAPGQQVTVTVRIQAGTSAVQTTQPRAAVEGYANGQLIGGVSIDVLLPRYVLFDGTVPVFLPMVVR